MFGAHSKLLLALTAGFLAAAWGRGATAQPVEKIVHGLLLLLLAAAVGGYCPGPVSARRTLNNI